MLRRMVLSSEINSKIYVWDTETHTSCMGERGRKGEGEEGLRRGLNEGDLSTSFLPIIPGFSTCHRACSLHWQPFSLPSLRPHTHTHTHSLRELGEAHSQGWSADPASAETHFIHTCALSLHLFIQNKHWHLPVINNRLQLMLLNLAAKMCITGVEYNATKLLLGRSAAVGCALIIRPRVALGNSRSKPAPAASGRCVLGQDTSPEFAPVGTVHSTWPLHVWYVCNVYL